MPPSSPAERRNEPVLGILCAVGGTILFSAQEAVFKYLSSDYSVMQLVFMRSWFVLVPTAVFIWRAGGPRILTEVRPGPLLLRGGLTFGAWVCYFHAIAVIPLADASALVFISPIAATLLAVVVLRERVGVHRWAAIVLGFVGVLVIVRPGEGTLQPAAFLALGSALFYAANAVLTRSLTAEFKSAALVFYNALIFMAVSGVAQPFVWHTPLWADVGVMAITGLFAGIAQFMITQAYRLAPVSVVAGFDYTHIIWASLFGFLIFHDVPGVNVLAGAVIVIVAGLYILHREQRARGIVKPRR